MFIVQQLVAVASLSRRRTDREYNRSHPQPEEARRKNSGEERAEQSTIARGAMAPKRGRARKGDRRIDAAIDHFAPMGYTARQVRTAVNALLKVRMCLPALASGYLSPRLRFSSI